MYVTIMNLLSKGYPLCALSVRAPAVRYLYLLYIKKYYKKKTNNLITNPLPFKYLF